MPDQFFMRRTPRRRGFTIAELLVTMALVTLVMSVLSQAFVEGLDAFRHLKATGDLQEQLRTDAVGLRRDIVAGHFATLDFVSASLVAGSPDPAAGGDLRVRYEAICATAGGLEIRLLEVERQTTNPLARRLIGRTLDLLASIKASAAVVVQILDLLVPPRPND